MTSGLHLNKKGDSLLASNIIRVSETETLFKSIQKLNHENGWPKFAECSMQTRKTSFDLKSFLSLAIAHAVPRLSSHVV